MTDLGCAPRVHRVCTGRALKCAIVACGIALPVQAELSDQIPDAVRELLTERCASFIKDGNDFESADLSTIPPRRSDGLSFMHVDTGLVVTTYAVEGRRACGIDNGVFTWSLDDRQLVFEIIEAFGPSWVDEPFETIDISGSVPGEAWVIRPLDGDGYFVMWSVGKTIEAPAFTNVTIGSAVFGDGA